MFQKLSSIWYPIKIGAIIHKPEYNGTVMSYNESVVKIYDTKISLVVFYANKNISFCYEKHYSLHNGTTARDRTPQDRTPRDQIL
jgi:hypothetical protein